VAEKWYESEVVFNTVWLYLYLKGKGKTIPLQACADPEGSRKLRLLDLKTIGT
jgi:hypothetical protein